MLTIFFTTIGCALASGWLTNISQEQKIYAEKNILGDTDYEIVYLNLDREAFDSVIRYDINAFGTKINLKLQPNEHLTAPNFSAVVRDGNITREIPGLRDVENIPKCHYLHRDEFMVAGVSLCRNNGMEGFLFLPNATLEIRPIPFPSPHTRLRSQVAHIIRKSKRIAIPFRDDAIILNHLNENSIPQDADDPESMQTFSDFLFERWKRSTKTKRMTIEAALFLDEPAYKIFAPFFEYDEEKLCEMLLAYINGVQALYHHPSLGKPIDIVLIKMEIFKNQPHDMPHFQGERNQLLDSFCAYNEAHNPKGDSNPRHWDMGLYISGLNFFALENGGRSEATMGLATVNGVCTEKYNCIIAEFGTTNVFGKPYPSAGFTSVYVLAHEMGHNIGMHHDSRGNNCPKEGFIMSPSRGTNGETVWSSCSAEVVHSMTSTSCLYDAPGTVEQRLDHMKYNNNPGQKWKAKKQCEILLRDRDAEVYNQENLQNICENLQCKTPHRSGFYNAGPVLQGTECGENKWCQGGKCERKTDTSTNIVKGGWSDWATVGECASGCLRKSRGYQPRRRTCTKPKPQNTDEGCEGPAYDVILCKDEKVCEKKKRKTAIQYATEQCQKFSKILSNLDGKASGLQAEHESARLWMACAIFCKRKDAKMYYTPRLELNDLGSDPYFPDGTWCHNDGIMNYYCLQHHCLPENFKYAKGSIGQEDLIFPQNAVPKALSPSKNVLQYLGLDLNGKPLLTTLQPDQINPTLEDDWTDEDYLEIPT